jgi:hypothetical protein
MQFSSQSSPQIDQPVRVLQGAETVEGLARGGGSCPAK